MNASAVRTTFLWAALLLIPGCGPKQGPKAARADAAWKTYRENPNEAGYHAVFRMTAEAAAEHGSPDDAVGVEYQVRVIELQAAEAVRGMNLELSETVVRRVDDWRAHDVDLNFEEVLPGARQRLADAKAKAETVK
jgi:hypothetical protein